VDNEPNDRSQELAALRAAAQGVLDLIDRPGGVAADDSRLVGVFSELVAAAKSKGVLPSTSGADQEALERSPTFLAERQAPTVAQALREAKSLARRLVEVQENERRSIARELHDEAGQALASLRYGLRLLEREIDEGGSATERVAELMQRTDAVIDSLHRLVADLRPASLDHLGLEAALRQYSRSAGSKFGLEVRFKARGFGGDRLPQVVETALYRVVQEAMANVVRHAHATRVDVLLEHRGDRVFVMVEDDGVGFEPDLVDRGNHFGLLGIQERAEALGGTLTLESTPGAGTTIAVEVASADPNPDR
jgi:signal transduction histidine kinase